MSGVAGAALVDTGSPADGFAASGPPVHPDTKTTPADAAQSIGVDLNVVRVLGVV
jgi:hypothetical protein